MEDKGKSTFALLAAFQDLSLCSPNALWMGDINANDKFDSGQMCGVLDGYFLVREAST